MDPELKSLNDVLQSYKQSLYTRLDKIDRDLQHAVAELQVANSPTASSKKYEISMQMVSMIPHYLKMLDISKSLSEGLSSKLCKLERDSPPERDRRCSNPFLSGDYDNAYNPDLHTENDNAYKPDSHRENDNSYRADLRRENDNAYRANLHRENDNAEASRLNSSDSTITNIIAEEEEEEEISQEENDSGMCPNVKVSATKNWWEQALNLLECKNRNGNKDKSVIVEIPQDDLIAGQTCVVSHIDTPCDFYIQNDPNFVETLENQLNEKLNRQYCLVINQFKSKEEAKTKLGSFCFGFLPEKNKYFRIEILDWLHKELERVWIQLIDHGTRSYCSYKNLSSMSELFATFPKMATRCHLAGIYSPNPLSRTKWLPANTEFFAEICGKEEKKKFVIIYATKEGDSYAVDLKKENDPEADSVGELLVEKGHARQEEFQDSSYSDDEIEDVDNINELIAGYDARDEARICPFSNGPGGCFKGAFCKLEHGQLSADGVTTDKIFTLSQSTLTKVNLPVEGQIVQILITGYIDTCHFYAHILDRRSGDNLYNDEFQALLDKMKSNNMVSTYEPFKIHPGISELVLVKEGDDWLRGSCISYTNDDKVNVFLLDFGNKKAKKLKDLRHMKEAFLDVPFQAVECMIHDCQEKKNFEEASFSFFNRFMSMEVFQGRVIESGKPLMLQLWGSNSQDMGLIFKQQNIGEDRIDLRPGKDYPLHFY